MDLADMSFKGYTLRTVLVSIFGADFKWYWAAEDWNKNSQDSSVGITLGGKFHWVTRTPRKLGKKTCLSSFLYVYLLLDISRFMMVPVSSLGMWWWVLWEGYYLGFGHCRRKILRFGKSYHAGQNMCFCTQPGGSSGLLVPPHRPCLVPPFPRWHS